MTQLATAGAVNDRRLVDVELILSVQGHDHPR